MTGVVGFILLVLVGWGFVLPLSLLVGLSGARRRERAAQDELRARRISALAAGKALRAIEWDGAWREMVPALPAPPESAPRRPSSLPFAPDAPVEAPAPPPASVRPPPPRPAPPPALQVAQARAPQKPLSTRIPPVEPRPATVDAPARGSSAEVRAAVEEHSAWRAHIRPFLVENIGWFIGGFLIIAGSLYFLREAWGSFAELGRDLLIVATALAYAGGFVGVGLWLKRSHGLATASRAMAYVGLSLLPVAALGCSGTFALRPLAWAIATPILLAAAYPLLYLSAGLLDPALRKALSRSMVALVGGVAVAPALARVSPELALLLPYAAWAVVHRASTAPLAGPTAPAAGVLGFHLSALAYGLVFVVGRAHVLGSTAVAFPAFYGPLVVLVAFTAMRLDVLLRSRFGRAPGIDVAVMACFAAAFGGIGLGASHPGFLTISAALAAALFAAAIAWYRRPLLVHFSLLSAAGALFALAQALRPSASLPPAALLFLAEAEGARRLADRFEARDDGRLGRAARISGWLLLCAGAALGGFLVLSSGLPAPLEPLAVVIGAAALITYWHARAPSPVTARAGAALSAVALALAGSRWLPLPQALAGTAIALAAAGAVGLRRPGERSGTAALLHVSVVAGLVAIILSPALPQLAVLAAVAGFAAVALGSALGGLLSAVAAGWGLCLVVAGPGFAAFFATPSPRWILVPAAGIAVAFLARWAEPMLPTSPLRSLPPRAEGFAALRQPFALCAGAATFVLALRAVPLARPLGAQMLGAAACAAALVAILLESPLWVMLAAASASLAGAFVMPAFPETAHALGGAIAAALVAITARFLPRHRKAALDTAALALVTAAVAAAAIAVFSIQVGGRDPDEVRVAVVTLAVAALALGAAIAPFRHEVAWPAFLTLAAAAALAPVALGKPATWSGTGVAALACAWTWTRFALRARAPAWALGPLRFGPPLLAAAAFAWNMLAAGPFLDWNRAICDGVLLAWLAGELATEGSPVHLHLLLAVGGLAIVRVRTLLGIEPTGWGTVVAGAALLGLAVALRRRERYARALFLWSALALGSTCAWALGPPFVRPERWTRMAAAALVGIPLGAWFVAPLITPVAVAALAIAVLGAVPALWPSLWLPATWPPAPAVLALVFALAAEAIEGREASAFYAPGPLRVSLRAGAILLGVVPAGLAILQVALAALRLSPAAGPGAVAAIPIVAGIAAAALAVRRADGGRTPALFLALAGVTFAALAIVLPAVTPWVPSAAVLVLVALSVAASFAGDLSLGSYALFGFALLATRGAASEWTTAAPLVAGIWLLRQVRLPLELSLPTWSGLAAAGCLFAWRAPAAGVWAPLAAVTAAVMLVHEWRGRRADATVLGVAVAVLAVATGGALPAAPALGIAAVLLLIFFVARSRRTPEWIHGAAAVAAVSWWFARARLGFAADSPSADAAATLAAATLYGLMAWLHHGRLFAYAAVILANVALFASWQQRGLDDLQLYTIPIGLSLLAAAQISHGDLGRQELSWLRGLGCLVLYAGTGLQMFRFDGAAYPLLLGGLAIATVAAGIALQIRAFAYLGTVTLVVDLVSNLARASVRSSRVLAVSATLTGFVILAGMIWLSVRREEMLALYRRLTRAMDDWE